MVTKVTQLFSNEKQCGTCIFVLTFKKNLVCPTHRNEKKKTVLTAALLSMAGIVMFAARKTWNPKNRYGI